MKWAVLAAVILYLFRDRIFGGIPPRAVVRVDPLYGPTPTPAYAQYPPTPPIGQPTNVYDTISAGITTAGDVIHGYLTGDN